MSPQPASGESSREPQWLRQKERGSRVALQAFAGLALTLGRPAVRLFLPLIAAYYLLFSMAPRRASRAYLNGALGRPATLCDVYRHYHSFASCVLDRVFFLKGRSELFDVRIHGEDVVTDLLDQGRGCILLGAHMGSFEALRLVGRRHPGLRINMVMYEENAQKVNSVLNALNPELAKDIISLGRPESIVTVKNCLDRGHFVGVLADRSLSTERQLTLPFLGRPAKFSINPFRMLGILQQPVVFMVALYRGGARYDLYFERFLAPPALERRPDPAAIEAMVHQYVGRLEHYCRMAPYNWFNFFDPGA